MTLKKTVVSSVLMILCAAVMFTGCTSVASKLGYQKIEAATQQIEQVREKARQDIESLKTEHVKELNNLVEMKDGNAQKASADLYGAIIAYETIPEPTRTEDVMGLRSKSAYARLPSPTSEQVLQQMDEVKKELNAALVTNDELNAKYKAKEQEALKAKADIKAKEDEIAKFQEREQQIKDLAAQKEHELQEERQKITQNELDLKAKEADAQDRKHKERMWIIGTLTFAAFAAGAGAIFVPIAGVKKNLFMFAAVCIAIAIAVPFIETWMVVTAFVVGGLLFGFPMLRNYYYEYKDATATYRAIQRAKDKDPDNFKNGLAVELAQWHSTYKKDKDGKVVTVPDDNVSKRIDQRLIETEEK